MNRFITKRLRYLYKKWVVVDTRDGAYFGPYAQAEARYVAMDLNWGINPMQENVAGDVA